MQEKQTCNYINKRYKVELLRMCMKICYNMQHIQVGIEFRAFYNIIRSGLLRIIAFMF